VGPPPLREERLTAWRGDELVLPSGLPRPADGHLPPRRGLPPRCDHGRTRRHPQHHRGRRRLSLLPAGPRRGHGVPRRRRHHHGSRPRAPAEGQEQEQDQRLEHGEEPPQRQQREQRAQPPRGLRRLHAPCHPRDHRVPYPFLGTAAGLLLRVDWVGRRRSSRLSPLLQGNPGLIAPAPP
jgi:hypothetical protein